MLHIDLKNKFYVEEQLDDIQKILSDNGVPVTKEKLRGFASGDLPLSSVDRYVDELHIQGTKQNPTSEVIPLYGACCIDHLFDITNTENDSIKPFSEINIGIEVFDECDPYTWCDISTLAARVQRQADRLQRLTELEAPPIILANVHKMVYNAISTFCCNTDDKTAEKETMRKRNGSAIRSLSDIEYSICTGWSPDMQAYIAEQEAELDRMWEQETKYDE